MSLVVVCGSHEDARLSIKHDGKLNIMDKSAGVRVCGLSDWTKACVIVGFGPKARAWQIVPGATDFRVGLGRLYVSGQVTVVCSTNNARKAREMFKEFKP